MNIHRLVPVLVLALCACQGTSASRPATAPAYAEACGSGAAELGCLNALSAAVERGERERAGQLLLLAARTAPAADRRDLARAGAWLAPNAWLPEELRSELGDEAFSVGSPFGEGAARLPAGTVLRLRGSTAPLGGGLHALSVDLHIPEGNGPLASASLAGLLAAASGADAASYGVGVGEAIAPAAPLLGRVLGIGLGLPSGSSAAAGLVARADRALRAGRHPEARQLLEQASAALPTSAPACSVRGALDYLRNAAARLGFDGSDDKAGEELREICTTATVGPDELDMQRFLRELGTLEANMGTAAAELPDPWSVPSELEGWSRDIEAFAGKLGGRRAALLRALRDDLRARTARPKGSCDLDFEQRTSAAREAVRKAIAASGRDDLVLPSIETKRTGARLELAPVEPLIAWLDRPENRWLRAPAWAALLGDASLALVAEGERSKLARLCQLAYGDVLRDMKEDRLEGYYGRNVSRWFAVARVGAICGNMDAVGELGNELLDGAAKGSEGKVGVLRVLWLSGLRAAGGFLNGRPEEGILAVKVLSDKLARLQERLGQSDEDRVLDALITVVRAGAGQLVGQPGDIEATLENVVVNLEGLARKPVRADAPTLAKAAPGVHLGAVALIAALHMRDEVPTARDAALKRLQAALDRDLEGLLASFGAAEHGDAIRRMVHTVPALARALDSGSAADLDALLAALEQADAPGPDEKGWWAVGLELARVALWDLGASAAHQAAHGKAPVAGGKPAAAAGKPGTGAGQKTRAASSADPLAEPRIARALDRTERILVRLADSVVRDYGRTGSGWEALYLGPAAHRALAALFAAPEDAPDLAARVADAAELGLAVGVPRMSEKLRTARPDEVGFLAVLVHALEAAKEVGGLRKLAADGAARTRWAERMKQRASGYPREFRVVVNAAIAGMQFESSPADARSRLQQAVTEATGTQLRDVAYLPRLVEAVLLHYDGDTAGALAAVDEVLALGNEALGCGRPHEVHGLMPYRAWALERLGKHAEADATLARYLEIGKTYGGDGFVHCRVASYRPTFTFTADVRQRLGGLFFPTSAEGTFQVGMGTGDARNLDRLACAPTPLVAPRLDLVLSAELARAAYAMRAGDEAAAHAALLAAVGTGRQLVSGDVRSLGGTDGAGAEESRKQAFLPLIAWVATAARGRGHLAMAAELDDIAQGIASARSETVAGAFTGRPGTPIQLALLGFDGLGPIVASTWQAPDATGSGTAARIGPPAAATAPGPASKKPAAAKPNGPAGAPKTPPGGAVPGGPATSDKPLVPAWGTGVLQAYSAFRQKHPAEAKAALGRVRPSPSDALGRITLMRTKASIGQGVPKMGEVKAAVGELARAGLLGEAAGMGAEQAALFGMAKKPAEARELYTYTLTLLPVERVPLLRAEILLQLVAVLGDEAAERQWAKDMAEVAPALQGRMPVEQELQMLQRLAVPLLRARELGKLLGPVGRLRDVMERAAGADSAQALQLSVALLGLRSVDASPPKDELADLLAKARRLGEVAAPLVPILEQLERNKDVPTERRRLAIEILETLLGK